MKTVSNDYKNAIKQFGKQIDSKITYTINRTTMVLDASQINSISLNYEGAILKSVMKELKIDSNIEIPVGTILSYEFGVLTDATSQTPYEYINYGNFVVYEVNKKEDTNSYEITCYDKMLYAMKDYEDLGITYPITIRNYINAICNKLGITFQNSSSSFANYNKVIPNELYLNTEGNSIGYTFRDVLDELAQVTASTICINKNDNLEIKYIYNTNTAIDEHSLKDINVNFGEKYGPINSIVLSRANSDCIYLQDEESVYENGLCEIKINDNQIMNGNDRDTYMQDILDKLDGLEYYLNDFSSPGITYYELCDMYSITAGNKTYKCVMFNDEINVTQGLEENIYTNMPKETETDYTKADKTDRRLNQTTLIVDKHEQEIQALIGMVSDISEIVDGIGTVTLQDAHKGTLHRIEIVGNISNIFPSNSDNLSGQVPYESGKKYPSSSLYPKDSYLQVDDETYKLDFNYLNYLSATVHDKYIYEEGKQWIERNVGIDANGDMYALDETIIEEKQDLVIFVNSDSVLTLLSHSNGQLKVEYLLNNKYTDTFATQAYVNNEVKVTADEINAEVNAKVGDDEIIAKLNLAIDNGQGIVQLKGNTVIIDSDNFQLDATGKIIATAGDIAGFEIDEENGFEKEIYSKYDYTQQDLERIYEIVMGRIIPTPQDIEKYDTNENGEVDIIDYIIVYWFIKEGVTTTNPAKFVIDVPNRNRLSGAKMGYINGYNQFTNGISYSGGKFTKVEISDKNTPEYSNFNIEINPKEMYCRIEGAEFPTIGLDGASGNITCVSLTQTSQEQNKKNFELYKDSALKEIQNIDIYKYNLKNESNVDKKHLGFVIGNNYKYSEQVTNNDNTGVDNYSFTSLLCKAIQEQQEQIEQLKKEIKSLKGGKNND